MKLLLDENPSRRIVPFLQTAFPGSTQIAVLGLESVSDSKIWQYAKDNGFVIVSRDSDFQHIIDADAQIADAGTSYTRRISCSSKMAGWGCMVRTP